MSRRVAAALAAFLATVITAAILRYVDLGRAFLVFTLADFLNLLALTVGLLIVTRTLDRRRSRDEYFKDLLLDIIDHYKVHTLEALSALEAAKGRKLNLQSSEDRMIIVSARKVAQQWADIKTTLKKYDKSIAESNEVTDVEREFESLRSYITGDVLEECIDARIVTAANNQHRQLMEKLLELRLKIMVM